jgi:glycosyltransferase involved in cell wall biosynthesis
MTILYICHEYPPGKSGGIGSITQTLARAMVASGHTVLVAGLYLPGYGEMDYEEDQGVRVWRKRLQLDIGIIKNDYSALDTLVLKSMSALGILQKDLAKSIGKFNRFINDLIQKVNIDIIEWPDFNAWFQYINHPLQWSELNVPLIVKFHGTQSYISHQMQEPVNKKLYLLEKDHISRATALASVSKNTAENYSRFYNLSQPVNILYNSIAMPPLAYRADQPESKIVFTGALTKLKGIFSLVKAWNVLNKKHPHAILEIFGKGKINAVLKEATPEARHSIHYRGFVSKDELYIAMSTAAAAIFPSYTECFALAPLEAMAAGCPVIYTERASGPELISSGINGLLVNPDDHHQMAEAMSSLIENEQVRTEFSNRGRKTIEQRFTINQSVQDHIHFYQEVIQKFQRSHIAG